VGGLRARLFRISFSGELAYEIAVPTRYGDGMIRKLMEAGAEYDAVVYGTEALGVMRIEKGHVAGNELNGTSTALNMGLGKMVSRSGDTKTLDVHVKRLRAKIENDPANPALIQTVRGLGYKMEL